MKNNVKITREQLKAMYDHISGLAFPDKRQKKDLKLYYSALTPNDIYVKFTAYSLQPDNSIDSELKVYCIKPNGSKMNCIEQFDDLRQRMQFETSFVEVDLDANNNIVFV
jgi:hypothetical protein